MLKFLVCAQNYLTQPMRRDDRGVTSVEYALMVALVAVAIAATVTLLAGGIKTAFNNVIASL